MAYCKNCGAYIPDGHTKCLACGVDEAEQQAAAAAAAQQAKENTGRIDGEFLRRQLEEQRKKQQENSRKWAEAERARRQAEQEHQAERFEKYRQSRDADFNFERSTNRSKSAGGNKVLAALSYLSIFCLLPFVLCRDDKFAMFHAKQGLRLFAASAVLEVLGSIVGMGWLVTLFRLYFIYKGMTNATSGKMEPLPYIGTLGGGN